MATVTVSSKYQVVIPEEVRRELDIKPGQKLEAVVWGGRLTLVPSISIAEARGMLAGWPNDFQREKTDRDL